ncbi:MAG: CDGSH iron-sulfur domain-containing protein [Acidobacteriota bacterium]
MGSETRKPSITPRPNGPYVVQDLERLSNRKGALETQPSMALCRCGGSANKPFCDGTHNRNGFSSAKGEDRIEDRLESYEGQGVTIHDNRGVCAHAGECTERLASVFRLRQEPWIDAAGAAKEEIIETVGRCPSGALSYSVGGVAHRDREGEPAIHVSPNGPYVVTGGPAMTDTAFGQGASTEHFTLCRCGASKNKPFCDGSHWTIGFADDAN